MASVADQLAWDALDDETKRIAREVLGADDQFVEELEERIEIFEQEERNRDTRDANAIDEIKRVEEAVANVQTLIGAGIADVNTMLKGLKARLAL